MKRSVTISCLMLFVFMISFSSADVAAYCEPAARACYGGEGDATDSSITGADGIFTGGNALGSGVSGTAFTFNGTLNNGVNFGDDLSHYFTDSNFSISLWFRSNGSVYPEPILFKGTPNSYYVISGPSYNGIIGAEVQECGFLCGQAVSVNSAPVTVDDGLWHFITLTIDASPGGSENMSLYIDGILVDSADFSSIDQPIEAGDLYIGRYPGGNYYVSNGSIDEVIIFNRPLEPLEISNMYIADAPPIVGVCGDGNLDLGEACDDNNLVNGDGCSDVCVDELIGVKRWENALGTAAGNTPSEISVADLEDTVVMVDGSSSVASYVDGDPVIFEVIEDDGLGGEDDIRVGANVITGYYNGTLGAAIGYWTITDEDILLTGDYDEFKFRIQGDTALSLTLSLTLDPITLEPIPDDDPAAVRIGNFLCGDYFDVGTTSDVDVVAFDSDDIITGTLTVLDGLDDSNPDFTFGNGFSSFSYDFNNAGNIRVLLDTVDLDGKRTINSTSLMVIDPTQDGDYLAACITEPANSLVINSSIVTFNAGGSEGIIYEVLTGTYTPMTLGQMDFSWRFFDIGTNQMIDVHGGDGGSPLNYNFEIAFAEVGDKRAELTISYP